MRRYQAYKDSGIDGLGRVPSHWEVLRLKYKCEVFPSKVDKHSRDDEPPMRLCNSATTPTSTATLGPAQLYEDLRRLAQHPGAAAG